MKTYKNLYPQIYSFENLHTAYRKARRGKRSRVEAPHTAPFRRMDEVRSARNLILRWQPEE